MRQRLGVALVACLGGAACGTTQPSPIASLNGTYLLTIESACAALPAARRRRTFSATIQDSVVTLSGSPFFPHPTRGLLNTMSMSQSGTSITLRADTTAGLEHVGLLDEPSPGEYWSLLGTGSGIVSPAVRTPPAIDGTFAAYVRAGADVSVPGLYTGCAPDVPVSFRFEPSPTPAPSPQAGTPAMTRLVVTGPESIGPGEAAQFEATGTFSDGTSRDVTADVRWFTSETTSHIASLTAPGLVRGNGIGETRLWAASTVPNTSHDPTAAVDILVAPPGTGRLAGTVTVAGSGNPIPGATVTVTAGQALGLTATTDWDGRYSLIGVAGPTTFAVSKAGYGTEQRSVSGPQHERIDVSLTGGPLLAVAGTYTLTVEADAACRAALPEPARRRVYQATLTQNSMFVTATLAGASFVTSRFEGLAEPSEVRFVLVDYWSYYWNGSSFPSLAETVSVVPWVQLVVSGRARVSAHPGGLQGELVGEFLTFDREVVCCPMLPWVAPAPAAACQGTHGFALQTR